MVVKYFCSGFDTKNAFWPELAIKFKEDLNNFDSIVYIPGGINKVEKTKSKYIPVFTNHFKNIGINFKKVDMLTPDMDIEVAKCLIKNASFIMLLGGDSFSQKEMCEKLEIMDELKNYNGVMLGFSAGAMLMSKYIIITPCSEEYPDFRIEEGLNLADISIYPHNNFAGDIYPEKVDSDGEIYLKEDLIKVASEYGDFYLLQDYLNENGNTDVSLIRSCDDQLEFITCNDGKVFKATKDEVLLLKKNL